MDICDTQKKKRNFSLCKLHGFGKRMDFVKSFVEFNIFHPWKLCFTVLIFESKIRIMEPFLRIPSLETRKIYIMGRFLSIPSLAQRKIRKTCLTPLHYVIYAKPTLIEFEFLSNFHSI